MKPCNQCGKCCEVYGGGGLSATAAELDFWEANRPEIFRYVSRGEIWADPESGEVLSRCPWLVKANDGPRYQCSIYHDRPDDCRAYPVLVADMIRDECEMIEPRDLRDLKATQQKLIFTSG